MKIKRSSRSFKFNRWIVPSSAGVVLAALFSSNVCAATCESLATAALPDSTITVAETVSTGAFTNPDGTGKQSGLPVFCRVSGYSTPSADSHIGWEVWFPVHGWVGRYQQVGLGGFNGALYYSRIGDMVKRGYAAAATDGGHVGKPPYPNWDLNEVVGHPERLIDHAYRAQQVTHDNAMALIDAYYGTRPRKSYFVGCSDGGREGLMMAKRFPTYFDGIVAGSPATYFTHIMIGGIKIANLMKDPARTLPVEKLETIQKSATAACQSALPGLVENPRQCHWDPASLLCTGPENDKCLISAQVDTVREVMKGTFNPRTGRMIFPGYNMFSGLKGFITASPVTDAQQIGQFVPALGMVAHQDTKWDFSKFNFDSEVDQIDNSLWGGAATVLPEDFTAFRIRGGKILMYHGWEDPVISPYDSINFYERMIRLNATTAEGKILDVAYPTAEYPYKTDTSPALGAKAPTAEAAREAHARALAATQQYTRLYMIPGINHCFGGPGPQSWTDATRQYGELVEALENWVEKGVAPDRIVVAKHAADKPDGAVQYTHPLCLYPKVAIYTGKGKPADAANWVCQPPRE